MTDYTAVRSRRGKRVHLTADYRFAICSAPCDGWVLMPDQIPTCPKCLRVVFCGAKA